MLSRLSQGTDPITVPPNAILVEVSVQRRNLREDVDVQLTTSLLLAGSMFATLPACFHL